MDTLRKINGTRILEIFEVTLENILLEIHLNVENNNNHFSFGLFISDDGEKIQYSLLPRSIKLTDFDYESYLVRKLIKGKDANGKLLSDVISKIEFGVKKAPSGNIDSLYYAKISTDKNLLLFFNNGDQGCCIINNVHDVLNNNIYEFEWVDMTG